jgi:hypothetical protein
MTPGSQVRAAAAVRAAVGLAMVTRAAAVARLLGAHPAGGHPVVRVLGLRHLGQAAVLAGRPDRAVVRGSSAVDGLHVLSCLLLAAASGSRRTPALRDAALESAVLLMTWTAGR